MFESCRAMPNEVRRCLPGDELTPGPIISLTHAITIDAPPTHVWPWLVQMGCDRAGWYSYDFLDNAGRPSATTLVPAWQHLAVGDVMPATPGVRDAFLVMDFTPGKMLLLAVPSMGPAGSASETPSLVHSSYASWVFVLEETTATHTRLITRARMGDVGFPTSEKPFFTRFATPSEFLYPIMRKLPRPVLPFLARLVHFIMVHKQMVGIKRRAERLALVDSSANVRAMGIVKELIESGYSLDDSMLESELAEAKGDVRAYSSGSLVVDDPRSTE